MCRPAYPRHGIIVDSIEWATGSAGMTANRNRLSRETVVAAACDLLDELGRDGLTMTALGERLGVTGMAAYRHVSNRADLEEAVVAYVLAEMFTDEDRDLPWDEGVACWMRGVRNRMKVHPWITRLMVHGQAQSASWLAALYELQLVLTRSGLSTENGVREIQRISRATVGTTMLEIGYPLSETKDAVEAALGTLSEEQRGYWRVAAKEFGRFSDDELFADIITDTVARLRRQGAGRRSR